MRAHWVTGAGGVRLYVEETGNPDGRPILFIHGFSQCRLAWRKQLESDLAADFRLVAMDIRGHGRSDKPRDAYGDSRLWAGDVHAVITTLGLERPLLAGWSYGGYIICDYLRYYGEEAISGIHLVAAGTKMGTEDAQPFRGPDFAAIVPALFSEDAEESIAALRRFLRLCVHAELDERDLYFFLGYNAIVPPYVRRGLFSRSIWNDDLLPRLTKPVLITHGLEDAIILPAAARHHQRLIPHARASFYEGVGHAPFWEDAERFNRELREFAAAL